MIPRPPYALALIAIAFVAGAAWLAFGRGEPAAVTPLDVGGGAQESSGGADAEVEEVPLSGTWRSTEDPRFTREFGENGRVIDRYEGDETATISGTWNLVGAQELEEAGFPVPSDDERVLRIQFPEEALFFSVTELSGDSLSLAYLGTNSTLTFTRVR